MIIIVLTLKCYIGQLTKNSSWVALLGSNPSNEGFWLWRNIERKHKFCSLGAPIQGQLWEATAFLTVIS